MRTYRFQALFLFLAVLCFISSGWTDTIHLRTGRTIKGRIIDETETQYQIEMTAIGATLWIDRDSVDRIETTQEAVPPTATPIPEPDPDRPRLEIIRSSDSREPTPPSRLGDPVRAAVPGRVGDEEIKATLITAADGTVEAQSGDGPWRPVQAGSSIGPLDRIRTSRDGRVELVTFYEDGSQARMRLMENTEVSPDPEDRSTINLSRGRLWSQTEAAEKAGEISLQVKAPNAVAAIRGRSTLVCFDLGLDGRAMISLFSGETRVEGAGGARQSLRRLQMAVLDRMGTLERMDEVDPDLIEEWDGWSETFEDLALYAHAAGGIIAGEVVESMARQIEEEHQLYAGILDDANTMILANRQAELLNRYGEGFTAYYRDMGRFPPAEGPFEHLFRNVTNDPDWNGPYLEGDVSLPVKDRWGTEILYELQHTPGGTPYLSLRSLGPNRMDDQGKGDDISVIIRRPIR